MFPQKDLSETQETLKSFFRVISEVILRICIRLIIRRLNVSVFSSVTPKSLFLVFWQIWWMAHRLHRYDRFLSYEQWVVSDEIWHKYWIGFPKMSVEITRTSQSHPELVSGSHRRKGLSKGSQWDAETSSAWPSTLGCYIEGQKYQKKNRSFCSSVKKLNLR